MIKPESLKNHYFALRHGHSRANEEGIIVSSPEAGVHEFGLSDLGRKQVLAAVATMNQKLGRQGAGSPVVFSSDFLRARQTADCIRRFGGESVSVNLDERLRERFFGDFEGQSNAAYQIVWKEDLDCPDIPDNGVESLQAVAQRASSLVQDIECNYSGRNIVLVAHGDILQILQCLFAGISPSRHRSLPHLETAELRLLNASQGR